MAYNIANVASVPADGQPVTEQQILPAQETYDVPFEDYIYYADRQRAIERQEARDGVSEENFLSRTIFGRRNKRQTGIGSISAHRDRNSLDSGLPPSGRENEKERVKDRDGLDEKNQISAYTGENVGAREGLGTRRNISVSEQEKINARRALRQAGWASVFFLITTDILGPFNAPYAIMTVGFVPGALLYFVMGAVAIYCGLALWKLFLKLDSDLYPVRTYGDLGHRIFGTWARHTISIIQSVQLVINVGTICLSNGQNLSQIIAGPNHTGHLCFAVSVLIWALLGMVVGQIRTLKSYGGLANMAVWINLLLIFLTMGFVAHSPPNFESAKAAYGIDPGPVITHTFATGNLPSQINGVMNMVFAFGGAMIFPEIIAEMRRPHDFWKGLALAQIVIWGCYMMFGIYVYAFQGQYTLPLAYQGVSKYGWQTIGNAMAIITGIIAAGLYGNIGIKVAYFNIVELMFKGPPFNSKRGRVIWFFMTLIYWGLAYIVGSAIPQVQTISGLVAALAIMQFTYTFPFGMITAYYVKLDGAAEDREHVVDGPPVGRIDTWSQWSRWRRGLFGGGMKSVAIKWINFILCLASFAMAGLGMYGSGVSIEQVFEAGAATSFGCTAPS